MGHRRKAYSTINYLLTSIVFYAPEIYQLAAHSRLVGVAIASRNGNRYINIEYWSEPRYS